MFVFVGLFEEMAFRAVINDAIIYRFRDKKYVFVLSAIASSLAFGAAHIIGADLPDIWACGIIHGVYDFLLSISNCFFHSPKQSITYVTTGETGKYAVIVYGVITLIELFIFWMIYRKIGKKIDYQKIREEW